MESRRETWAREICNLGNAGRYLLPGHDLEFLSAFHDSGAVDVRTFLERLDERGGSFELLASAYWLSQPEVQEFIFRDLPALLKNLGHGSRSSPPSVESTFRGRVLWQETILGRYSGSIPRGRYLVQHVEKSADIPENRLLKLFLTRIVTTTKELTGRGSGALPLRIARLHDAAALGLANAYLAGVELEHRIGARMLSTAFRHRDARYSRLAHLALDFDRAVIRGKWVQILNLLNKGWLAPVSSEDLFELYVLILIMQAIEGELGFGEPQSYGLIQRNRSAVATYCHPDGLLKAEVFFDQVPSGMFETSSEYVEVVASHNGFSVQERRPDILVRFSAGDAERRVLIEIKETEDPAYARESVYKVLGYLRDFADIWTDIQEQKPKALLVFPTGVFPKGPPADIVMASADRNEDLVSALRSAIGDMADGKAEGRGEAYERLLGV